MASTPASLATDGAIPAAPAAASVVATTRLGAIDALRGIVIALMALDHVRDYFSNAHFDPMDLDRTDPALYATRWVTHFCAPIFVLLSGVSAYLISLRVPRARLSAFLVKRGLWLVILELTLVNFAWTFRVDYQYGVWVQVIWAIGISMIVLAALVHLPVFAVGALGVAMIALHNLLDGVAPETFGALAPLWTILHVQGNTPWGFVAYPLIPWMGVMAAGYALGAVYTWEAERRRRFLVLLGAALVAGFFLLRYANFYGDPQPWAPQRSALWTFLSFMDLEKYPPSLLYLAITLGPGLVALAWLERVRGALFGVFETFGRVPLFAYLGHIVLAHLAAGLVAMALGHGTLVLANPFYVYPDTWGFGLAGVYAAWIAVLALLYPLCRWFAGIKRRRRDWWLSYL